MIDLFLHDLQIDRIDSIKEGFRIMLRNKPKDESVSLILSEDEFKKLQILVTNRCETQGIIPIHNRTEVKT